MAASLVATLEHPRWWLLALAGFLVRGGLLVFLLPIVVLPTPAGLTNAVAPTLVGFVFGSPSESFVTLVVVLIVGFAAWLLLGGLLAAWIDVALAGEVARDRQPGSHAPDRPGLAWRALVARLASHLPLAIVLSWAAVRLVEAVYAEYVTPGDVTVPIVLRVVLRIPEVIAAIVVVWLAGETAGGLAVRHLALRPRTSMLAALARSWLDLLVRPTVLASLLVTNAVVIMVSAPAAAAAAFAWGRLRTALAAGLEPYVVATTVAAFVTIWLAGLGLAAVAVAWRGAAWTYETARRLDPGLSVRHTAPGEAV